MESQQNSKVQQKEKILSNALSTLIISNLVMDKDDLDTIKLLLNRAVHFEDPNYFISVLLDNLKQLEPTKKEIKKEVEKPKEETKKIEKKQNIKPEIEKPKIEQKTKKEELKEIDDKIKAIQAKHTIGSRCYKDEQEIERLYKLKNKDREDKFKKNSKNGKIVETEEQKELLKKYRELEKTKYNKNDCNEIERSEIGEKIKFQKSIFVEDKEFKIFSYSEKHSYSRYRCIIISETDKFYKILPIDKVFTHFDDNQSSHYKFEYPVIIREDKIIKYHKNRYFSPVEYHREDTDYTLCD
jgi:hypothetical protein